MGFGHGGLHWLDHGNREGHRPGLRALPRAGGPGLGDLHRPQGSVGDVAPPADADPFPDGLAWRGDYPLVALRPAVAGPGCGGLPADHPRPALADRASDFRRRFAPSPRDSRLGLSGFDPGGHRWPGLAFPMARPAAGACPHNQLPQCGGFPHGIGSD